MIYFYLMPTVSGTILNMSFVILFSSYTLISTIITFFFQERTEVLRH